MLFGRQGRAVANGVIYVAGFEGIDDGFSDSQFGVSFESGIIQLGGQGIFLVVMPIIQSIFLSWCRFEKI